MAHFSHDDFGMSLWERARLERSPRFRNTYAPLLGKRVAIPSPYWFLHDYRQIFVDEIYKFQAKRHPPLIVDCGANIGLSTIYFKHIFPDAHIVAYEPDPGIFGLLETNVMTFGLEDVELHEEAVWISQGEMAFYADGTVGGSLTSARSDCRLMHVQCTRLRDVLGSRVDFLKLDIEGAELQVLKDCADVLTNVDHLFVEYHSKQAEPQGLHELLEVVKNAGLRYHIKEAYPVPHPFLEEARGRYYDLQLNIFGFAPGKVETASSSTAYQSIGEAGACKPSLYA